MSGPVGSGQTGPIRSGPSRPAPTGPRHAQPGPVGPAPFGGPWGPWGWFGPQSVPPAQFTFIAPLIFPYLGYPPAPGDYAPAQGPAEEEGGPGTAAAPAEYDSLPRQVETLTDEVDDLRQQQESGESAEAGPQPALEPTSAPAVFVYLDGQQFEAQSYAVLGGTLWIYEDDAIRKIPLAKLDLDETRKLNDERGIDFSVIH